ncbi:MAG: MerC domain-containing protein [Cyclobacteriaceae bacterium]
MKKFLSFHLDVIGFSASLICALHCAIVPLLLTFSALGSVTFMDDPVIELSMISISLILAMSSLLPCYFSHHHRIAPLIWAVSGFLLIAIGNLAPVEKYEILLTPAGGCLVAMAHYTNWRKCNKQQNCKSL